MPFVTEVPGQLSQLDQADDIPTASQSTLLLPNKMEMAEVAWADADAKTGVEYRTLKEAELAELCDEANENAKKEKEKKEGGAKEGGGDK